MPRGRGIALILLALLVTALVLLRRHEPEPEHPRPKPQAVAVEPVPPLPPLRIEPAKKSRMPSWPEVSEGEMWSGEAVRLYGYGSTGPSRTYKAVESGRFGLGRVYFGVLTGKRKSRGDGAFVEVSILRLDIHGPRYFTTEQGWLLLSSVEDPEFAGGGFPWVDR